MPRPFCQEHPDVLEIEEEVLEARAGAIRVARAPFFAGGGGQLADRGSVRHAGGAVPVVGVEAGEDGEAGTWLRLEGDPVLRGRVLLTVDAAFRALMCELHTVAHIVNSIAFQAFDGALLTGAQLGADGTLRVDLDLPGVDNDRLRALEAPINAAIRRDHGISALYMRRDLAEAEHGLFRSKATTPPLQADGMVRVVEIDGLDRQACGGTHLPSTGRARAARILKVESKGRHNRRVRVGMLG